MTPDLSNILTALLTPDAGSDVPGAPAVNPLPSLSLAGAVAAPSAPAGSMHPMVAAPMPAPSPGAGKIDLVRDLAPLLISAAMGVRNPYHGAAIAHGAYQGMMAAQQEGLAQEQRDEQKRALATRFMQQTAADVLRLKDPIERQTYLQYAHDIGVQQFGMPQGWTKNIPAHDGSEDVTAKLKTELGAQLAAFDKNKQWAGTAGTPAEAKISFRLSNGSTVPVNMARQLVGQAVYDATGTQAYAPEPDTTGKTEQERAASLLSGIRDAKARGDVKRAATLQAAYDDLIRVKRDIEKPPSDAKVGTFEDYVTRKYGPDPTPQQVEAARRAWGDEGRAAPINITLPDMPGMSAKDRVESAAQDILNNRMAPSQLATFFTGMGKESASQLRSLVMQRVKQMQPDFNFAAAESNYQFGKSTGTQNTVRYIDNVKESFPMLIDRAQKLANGNVRSINSLVNAGKDQFNDVDLKRFRSDATTVADEIAKILQGGGTGSGTSDAKLKQAGELLRDTDSPAAIKAALDDIGSLLGFRRSTLTKGTFMEDNGGVSPSKAKLRYNPATGKMEAIK